MITQKVFCAMYLDADQPVCRHKLFVLDTQMSRRDARPATRLASAFPNTQKPPHGGMGDVTAYPFELLPAVP